MMWIFDDKPTPSPVGEILKGAAKAGLECLFVELVKWGVSELKAWRHRRKDKKAKEEEKEAEPDAVPK